MWKFTRKQSKSSVLYRRANREKENYDGFKKEKLKIKITVLFQFSEG